MVLLCFSTKCATSCLKTIIWSEQFTVDLNLCFPPQPLPFLTFPFKPCGKCSLSLPVPVCLCRPSPVQETHGRRNSSKVISLGQSNEDGSSQREIFEGKGHLVWTRPVTHCSPTLPLSLSAMPQIITWWKSQPAVLQYFTYLHRRSILACLHHCWERVVQ